MGKEERIIIPESVGKKFRAIRERLGRTQESIAISLSYGPTFIGDMEREGIKIPLKQYAQLKKELKITDVPFLDFEKEEFEEELREWKDLVYAGDFHKASELMPGLARRAKLSDDTYLMTQYELSCAYYYFVASKMDEFNHLLNLLGKKEETFIEKQRFFYYYLKGLRDSKAAHYKIALVSLFKAEEAGKRIPLAEQSRLPYDSLYYYIAFCLAFLQYAVKSEEYLNKYEAIFHKKSRFLSTHFIHSLHIRNLITLQQYAEAISVIKTCMLEGKGTSANKLFMSTLHRSLGRIYYKTKEYNKAIVEYDTSLRYTNKDSELYCFTLYLKAQTLLAAGKTDEGTGYIEKGLTEVKKDTNTEALLMALKHSINLKDPSSLRYMETVAIPKLIEYGDRVLAAEYCNALQDYFCEISTYKRALHYCRLELEIRRKLWEGDLSL